MRAPDQAPFLEQLKARAEGQRSRRPMSIGACVMPWLSPASRASASRRISRRMSAAIFLGIFLLYGSSLVGGMHTGDLVNYGLTRALVERQTIYLDIFDVTLPPRAHISFIHILTISTMRFLGMDGWSPTGNRG